MRCSILTRRMIQIGAEEGGECLGCQKLVQDGWLLGRKLSVMKAY